MTHRGIPFICAVLTAFVFSCRMTARSFVVEAGQEVAVSIDTTVAPVVKTSFEILQTDLERVLDARLSVSSYSPVIVCGIDSSLDRQGFRLEVDRKGRLVINGADPHGLAYGLLEVSRLAGVSPWEWWADAVVRKIPGLKLKTGVVTEQSPSVEYRGIFINDEDWGMMPWSWQTNDKAEKGVIGPGTYSRIFELMLRLRANCIWPAMHECTRPFFLTEGNREAARRYGIFMGGSHCEPMACSTAREWGMRGEGQYNYVTNSAAVQTFWTDRLKEVKDMDILYTIGMRGVHDGGMAGVKTAEDKVKWLQKVIDDQRAMLATYVDADVESVPQVFIPYKEVQEIYDNGLDVPDDVCLMWCDDNYGYIRHFPTATERSRKGGNGVYYHASYWGAPQDYLWLGTFSPSLLFEQMTEAWDRGIQRVWILNVGDLKPLEYQMELFLDMAWDIDAVKGKWTKGNAHLEDFLCREFGEKTGKALAPLMTEHYRLAYVRKPEFMGGTRVYEADRNEWYKIVDCPWTDEYVDERLKAYSSLEDEVERIAADVPADRADTYFQLVKYPVQAAAEMNRKFLYAQKARHTGDPSYWRLSDEAYDSIASLTHMFNKETSGGKWNHMMDFRPRGLSVFDRVPHQSQSPDPSRRAAVTYAIPEKPVTVLDGTDFSGDTEYAYGLGLEGKAVKIGQDGEATATFTLERDMKVELPVRLLPRFPVDEGGQLRLSVTVDDNKPVELSFRSVYHGEQWKQGVIQNYAERSLGVMSLGKGKHKVKVKAVDDGIVFDQILIMEAVGKDNK